jgi:hypothetical protein
MQIMPAGGVDLPIDCWCRLDADAGMIPSP